MIIFKFILTRFKQNLWSGCSNIYFRGVKTIFVKKFIYIKKKNFARSKGSNEPPGQHVMPPLPKQNYPNKLHKPKSYLSP